jgi:diketogulonate reductase-like aldo/keto reductase
METKSGKKLHPIGMGTWEAEDLSAVDGLQYSLSKGQNHIDTAEMYGSGKSEQIVGQAIKGTLREDLFIASKLWKTNVGVGRVKPAIEDMLARLGTDYLDLLYIHAPWVDAPWLEAIPQIDKAIDSGLVRNFGVSNFTIQQMQQAMEQSKHPIAANQLHFNVLYKQEAAEELRTFCKSHDITIVAYRPVERTAVAGNAELQNIAKNHKASPFQVALRWLIDRDALPIPKATKKEHIDDNLKALDLSLSREELALLDSL